MKLDVDLGDPYKRLAYRVVMANPEREEEEETEPEERDE